MPESPIIRFISVIVVMLVFGFGWYGIALTRLKRKGLKAAETKAKAATQAKYVSLLAVFIYLISMVSIAGLFMR